MVRGAPCRGCQPAARLRVLTMRGLSTDRQLPMTYRQLTAVCCRAPAGKGVALDICNWRPPIAAFEKFNALLGIRTGHFSWIDNGLAASRAALTPASSL